jgi:hypothetical protein
MTCHHSYINGIATESYGRLVGISNAIMYFAAADGLKQVYAKTMSIFTTTVDWSQFTRKLDITLRGMHKLSCKNL